RNSDAEPLVGNRVLRVSAIDVIAGESRPLAEVLAAGQAIPALPTRPAKPRHTDATTWVVALATWPPIYDRADDPVTGDQRKLRMFQLRVQDMEVRPADAARSYPEQALARPRRRNRPICQPERLTLGIEDHRL